MSIYSSKLDGLVATIDSVATTNLNKISDALHRGKSSIAYAIGSGGSASTAEYFSHCRSTVGAAATCVQTPLEFVLGTEDISGAQIWLFSARGENPDVLAVFECARIRNAGEIHIVTNGDNSSLECLANGISDASVHKTPVTIAKDGFLATHSLVSAVTLLLLATDASNEYPIGKSLAEQFTRQAKSILASKRRENFLPPYFRLHKSDLLILLSDPLLAPAATVIETSVWETAICSIQRTDFRNFAHGRHVWLAHRPNQTVLLGLTGGETCRIWNDLVSNIPSKIRRYSLDYGNCGRLQVALAILDALILVEQLGYLTNIDPAKPGVGPFASSIYEDTSLLRLTAKLTPAVRHKSSAINMRDDPNTTDVSVSQAFEEYCKHITSIYFSGLVLDYDGTIVKTSERKKLPDNKIIHQIIRLLNCGIKLAIATGRGGSAGEALREVIPVKYHDSILIGYYNGAYIKPLSIDINKKKPKREKAIDAAYKWLSTRDDLLLQKLEKKNGVQITIQNDALIELQLFSEQFDYFNKQSNSLLKLVRSGHSIDICLAHTCKTDTVKALASIIEDDNPAICCIGDRGAQGGNDHALLGNKFGISVCDVSGHKDYCWSFFGSDITGPDALERILTSFIPVRTDYVHFQLNELG